VDSPFIYSYSSSTYLLLIYTSITKSGPKDESIFLADLEEDEIFGEMGWLDRSPRSATVTAKTRLAIRVLKEEDAVQFMVHNPRALLPILRVLGSRLRETLRLIEKFTQGE